MDSHNDISVCLTLYPLPLEVSVFFTPAGLGTYSDLNLFLKISELYN